MKRLRGYGRLVLSAALALVLGAAVALATAPGARAIYLGYFTAPPAIAWTGSNEVLAAVDANLGNLDYWWQHPGTGEWTEEVVASGNFYTSPAIAWTGSSVVITAIGSDGHLYYWWQAAGTTPWHQETVSAMDTFGSDGHTRPAIAWTGSSVVIAAADSVGAVWYWWQPAGGTTWNQQLVSTTATFSPQIAWTGSAVEIVGGDERDGTGVNYFWQAAGTTPWHSQLGSLNAPAAIAAAGNSAIGAAVGQSTLFYGTQPDSTTWNLQSTGINTDGGNPVIAWAGSYPVIAGNDGGNVYLWQPVIFRGITLFWQQQTVATIPSPTDIYIAPAMTWTGHSVVVAATTLNGQLFVWSQSSGSTTWTQQVDI